MDVVCGETNWDVCLTFDKGNKLRGILVYHLKKKYGLKFITQPPLTPYTGIWLEYEQGMTHYRRNRFEKKTISALLMQLPSIAWIEQRIHYNLTNWLPFYWQKFRQTTRYTNLLNTQLPIGTLYQNIRYNIRWSIRQANKNNIQITHGNQFFEEFYQIYSLSAKNNGIQFLPKHKLERIHQAIQEMEAGDIFLATDENDQVHAGAYILWDKKSAYYWLGASDERYRKSGAVPLLLWKVIQVCAEKAVQFDFDGSMNEGTEQFFSAFGTSQTPCFLLTKCNDRFWETIFLITNRRR